ncbi:MAG: hypothetical protein ABI405_13795 [Parafilimonas sp.]
MKTQIFQTFFTTKPAGSGTGLSLSYDIIKAHGGEIKVPKEIPTNSGKEKEQHLLFNYPLGDKISAWKNHINPRLNGSVGQELIL